MYDDEDEYDEEEDESRDKSSRKVVFGLIDAGVYLPDPPRLRQVTNPGLSESLRIIQLK